MWEYNSYYSVHKLAVKVNKIISCENGLATVPYNGGTEGSDDIITTNAWKLSILDNKVSCYWLLPKGSRSDSKCLLGVLHYYTLYSKLD